MHKFLSDCNHMIKKKTQNMKRSYHCSLGEQYITKTENGSIAIALSMSPKFRENTNNAVIVPPKDDKSEHFLVKFDSELDLEEIRNLLKDENGGYFMHTNVNHADKFTGEPYYHDDTLIVTSKNGPIINPKCALSPHDHIAEKQEIRNTMVDKCQKIPEMYPEESDTKSIFDILNITANPFGKNCPGHCPYYDLLNIGNADEKTILSAKSCGPKPAKCNNLMLAAEPKCNVCGMEIYCLYDCIPSCEYCFSDSSCWVKTRQDYYLVCKSAEEPNKEPHCEDFVDTTDGDAVYCKACYQKARLSSRYRRDCKKCLAEVMRTKGKPRNT